jgi:hypothetical protein
MSSRTKTLLLILVLLLPAGCSRVLPWQKTSTGTEVNLAFTLRNNLVELPTLRIDNRAGRFLLGTAAPHTVIDPAFAGGARAALVLNERKTVRVAPASLGLSGAADAIIGADAWQNRAVTIDYRSGLVTWQSEGIFPGYMALFHYPAEPMVEVSVDGETITAIVDTTSPDTLLLPAPENGRRIASVSVAGTDFGAIDVRTANVRQPRIGNRLLSRFLVTVDYGRRIVGLWRDPRIPLSPAPPSA